MSAKVTVLDNLGEINPEFSLIEIKRGFDHPAQFIHIEFYEKNFRGEAKSIQIESENYRQNFLVDRHVQAKNQNGCYQTIEARSNTGLYLLDNQAYPRSYENFTLERLVALLGAGYALQGVQNGEMKTLPLFVIREGESIWEILQNFAMQAYNKEIFLLENGWIYIGKPNFQGQFTFSNSENNCLPYGSLEYQTIPKARISQIRALDENGNETAIMNPEVNTVIRREYQRNETIFSKKGSPGNLEKLIRSLQSSYQLMMEYPGYFKGSPGDLISVLDLNENNANWQIEKGVWKWDRGWSTKLVAKLYRYRW